MKNSIKLIAKIVFDTGSSLRATIMRSLVFSKISTLANKRVIDLGCGDGAWGYHMRFVKDANRVNKVGVDVFKPSLERCKRRLIYDDVALADVRYLPFKDGAFDFVFSVFVLEHLKKRDGYIFLEEAERICREVFVYIAEHGYKPDAISVPKLALKENPFLHHLSGWTYTELRRRGFAVRGINSILVRKTRRPFNIIFYILILFAYFFPQIADKLIFWKRRSRLHDPPPVVGDM